MSEVRICIAGIGMVSPLACGVPGTVTALKAENVGIAPIRLFQVEQGGALPVGQVRTHLVDPGVPRTHNLALIAAREALAGSQKAPDAIVIGGTTGGMFETEEFFRAGCLAPERFTNHSPGSVADYLAAAFHCPGPVVTVSTACSSGAVAIQIAVEMLRAGKAKRVLAGGADGLCRLTYYGFRSLQLMDPAGARPLDRNRNGMTLGEGAGMLLLEARGPGTAGETGDPCEVLGAGLSCDAYHPAAPDPQGAGALTVMRAALEDAGLDPSGVDYVSLHGTGTRENDLSEARALNALFGHDMPPLSSVKGAMGHTLAASGAIEAGIAVMSIQEGLMPGTTGCTRPDPRLGVDPLIRPLQGKVESVLSNAFGFGGNNASVVIGRRKALHSTKLAFESTPHLTVVGSACISGAGGLAGTIEGISQRGHCTGILPEKDLAACLSPRAIRRFKRLSRMALSLSVSAHGDAGTTDAPSSVFFSTGWGGLSETYGFLTRLRTSEEAFSSPTAFVGSVHNAPAGHIAVHFRATGPNVTVTGGDYSFEQCLLTAGLLLKESGAPALVVGADEYHEELSRRFDGSAAVSGTPSDGGGALCVTRGRGRSGPKIAALFLENGKNNDSVIGSLITTLGGVKRINAAYGAVLAGIPAACADLGREQLTAFLSDAAFQGLVIPYRRLTGEFASASALAAVLGVAFVKDGVVPDGFSGPKGFGLQGKGILMLGFGTFVTGVEII